jgi:hypothetical protein
MFKNKFLIAGALLSVLLIVLGIFYFGGNYYKDTFASVEFTQFAVEQPQKTLKRIFLADRENNLALLEKQNDGSWKYTNKTSGKTYNASPNAINNLLETIEKVRVRNRVPNPSIKTVLRGIGTIGVKVELYDMNNKKIRTYYVGGPADGSQGTFAVVEGSDIPYVLNVPGFNGTIDTRFTAKEPALRDRAIVRHNTKDLESMQVEYFAPEQRPYSFKLELGVNAKVKPLYSDKEFPQSSLRKDYVDIYLSDFNVLSAEMILYKKELRDSIIKTPPFARVSYKYKGKNEEKTMTLYPVINSSYDRGDGMQGNRQKLIRYYVDIDEDNFFLTQDIVIQKLLRPYEFFFNNVSPVKK